MDPLFEYYCQFVALSEEAKKLLAGTTNVIVVPKGAILVHQGQANRYSYLIGKGLQKLRALYNTNFGICNLVRLLVEDFVLRFEARRKLYRDQDALQKYEQFLTDKPGLILRVKQKHIASFIGISSETLNRVHSMQTKIKKNMTDLLPEQKI